MCRVVLLLWIGCTIDTAKSDKYNQFNMTSAVCDCDSFLRVVSDNYDWRHVFVLYGTLLGNIPKNCNIPHNNIAHENMRTENSTDYIAMRKPLPCHIVVGTFDYIRENSTLMHKFPIQEPKAISRNPSQNPPLQWYGIQCKLHQECVRLSEPHSVCVGISV